MKYKHLHIITIFFLMSVASASQPASISERLEWIDADEKGNLCHGYYQEPSLNGVITPLSPGIIKLSANKQLLVLEEGTSTLTGNVLIRQLDRQLNASEAKITRNAKGDIEKIELVNDVRIQEPGMLLLAQHGEYRQNHTGELVNAFYRLGLGKVQTFQLENGIERRGYALNAWGKASHVQRKSRQFTRLQQTTYTTCRPDDNTWKLQASEINLNQETGRGQAKDVTVKIKDIPVFYLPYFNFPIDKRRQSGFLTPTYGTASRSGFFIGLPYYFNLAPNYDDTFTPQLFSKRGLLFNNAFRYLDKKGKGEINFSFLPDDKEFADFKKNQRKDNPPGKPLSRLENFNNDRWLVNLEDKHQVDTHWSSLLDFTQVSDDYYFQDFGRGIFGTSENQLPQIATLTYADKYWKALASLQNYQTLHPINQPHIDDSYSRLPQLVFNINYPDEHGIEYGLDSEAVHFYKPHDPDTGQVFTTGNRTYLSPNITYPIEAASGYIMPRLQLPFRHYDLQNQILGRPNTINRILPMFDVDSGLFFDRETRLMGKNYRQTFEPRFYYLYVPFLQQRDIPLFDTVLQSFSYEQLFRDNRFSGIDRIGDANQLSVALTTRFLEQDTGIEKLTATIGQIYYFSDRRVTLCNIEGCKDKDNVGFISQSTNFSPLTGNVTYQLNPRWSVRSDAAWEPQNGTVTNGNFVFHYQPIPKKIVDLGYHFTRNAEIVDGKVRDLNQAGLAFYWPIKERWGTIGAWNYNIVQRHAQMYFYGVEYSGCCWATRVIMERDFVALNPQGKSTFNNIFYLQLQLKGLATVGTGNAGKLLQTQLPGYQDFLKTS